MAVTAPPWLTAHEGSLQPSTDGHAWMVMFAGRPLYLLVPVPAKGKFACQVTQTNNGRRLDGPGTYATEEEAVRGGLEDLRKALGW
jgi:hypothetical protein